MSILKAIANYFLPKEEVDYTATLGRNEACWCGSGRKYKKCHLPDDEKKSIKKSAQNCGPA
jgi:uncharacterized protein YecA (UPF0149 family)